MHHRNSLTTVVVAGVVLAAAACSKSETPSADTTKSAASAPSAGAAPATAATKLGETGGMKTPESVRYDPELDVYYVSNINGNPSKHDGNGFIAVVRADSTSMVKMLAEGGIKGVKLDAPKGLALVGDTLWVADIDHVRALNRRTGAVVADIDLSSQHATFLNDVVVGPDGSIYVTDSGLFADSTGAMTHPGTDQIFKITGRTATVITADSLNAPNGIAWDKANSRFVLGPSNGKAVQTWKAGDKSTATLVNGPGGYDGVEVLGDGRILVTSWADSALHVIQNGAMSTLATGLSGPADIGVDTKRNVVAVPRFMDGKVEYFKIP